MDLAGDIRASQALDTYLDVFTHHYLQAKHQLPPDQESAAHQRLRGLRNPDHRGVAGTIEAVHQGI